jgi:hypothetical protein
MAVLSYPGPTESRGRWDEKIEIWSTMGYSKLVEGLKSVKGGNYHEKGP